MNICHCGTRAGYPHREDCPFPLYNDVPTMVTSWEQQREIFVLKDALVILATESYTCLMKVDPGNGGMWHSLIRESLSPLGREFAGRMMKGILTTFEDSKGDCK